MIRLRGVLCVYSGQWHPIRRGRKTCPRCGGTVGPTHAHPLTDDLRRIDDAGRDVTDTPGLWDAPDTYRPLEPVR